MSSHRYQQSTSAFRARMVSKDTPLVTARPAARAPRATTSWQPAHDVSDIIDQHLSKKRHDKRGRARSASPSETSPTEDYHEKVDWHSRLHERRARAEEAARAESDQGESARLQWLRRRFVAQTPAFQQEEDVREEAPVKALALRPPATTLRKVLGLPTSPPPLSQCALVLIDVQVTYTEGPLKLAGVEKAVKNCAAMLQRARHLGIPIIHVRHHAGEGTLYDINGRSGAFVPAVSPVFVADRDHHHLLPPAQHNSAVTVVRAPESDSSDSSSSDSDDSIEAARVPRTPSLRHVAPDITVVSAADLRRRLALLGVEDDADSDDDIAVGSGLNPQTGRLSTGSAKSPATGTGGVSPALHPRFVPTSDAAAAGSDLSTPAFKGPMLVGASTLSKALISPIGKVSGATPNMMPPASFSPMLRARMSPMTTGMKPKPAAPQTEYILTKALPNSFEGTALETILTTLRVKNVVLIGFMTHCCVQSTARAAFNKGFNPIVVADCTATRDLPDALNAVGADDSAPISAALTQRVALTMLTDLHAVVVPNGSCITNS